MSWKGKNVKKRYFFLVVFLIIRSDAVFAESWTASVDASVMVTQNAYTENWVGGEIGSMSWIVLSNSLAEKQLHPKVHTRNTLKLQFGQNHMQDKETKDWGKPIKSNDLIDFESVFRFSLGGYVDPFASSRIEPQFLDKRDSLKDRYINPLTLTESLGIAKVLVKEEKCDWTARLGAGFREHINRARLDAKTGKHKTKVSADSGLVFVNEFATPLAQERISLTCKLIVFQTLFYSESDELKSLPGENYWKFPDIEWENIFSASITQYLMVNLYTQFLYDKEIDRAGRFKQTLSLGVAYNLL